MHLQSMDYLQWTKNCRYSEDAHLMVLQYYGKHLSMPTAPLNVMTVTELWA